MEAPREFAREVGAGLGEYLCRALSLSAAIADPKDLAWLLASYARDGLARVEAAGDAPSLTTLRGALEEGLGVRFEDERGAAFFRSTLVQTLFYGIFSAWVLWARQTPRPMTPFDWHDGGLASARAGSAGVVPADLRPRSGCGRWAWWKCWTGRRRRSTGWTRTLSLTASMRARPSPTSTSRSWKRSTPTCASSWASGTRRRKWCATWSPASTRR